MLSLSEEIPQDPQPRTAAVSAALLSPRLSFLPFSVFAKRVLSVALALAALASPSSSSPRSRPKRRPRSKSLLRRSASTATTRPSASLTHSQAGTRDAQDAGPRASGVDRTNARSPGPCSCVRPARCARQLRRDPRKGRDLCDLVWRPERAPAGRAAAPDRRRRAQLAPRLCGQGRAVLPLAHAGTGGHRPTPRTRVDPVLTTGCFAVGLLRGADPLRGSAGSCPCRRGGGSAGLAGAARRGGAGLTTKPDR